MEYFYSDIEDVKFVLNNDFIYEKKNPKYIKDTQRELNRVFVINKEFSIQSYQKIYDNNNN